MRLSIVRIISLWYVPISRKKYMGSWHVLFKDHRCVLTLLDWLCPKSTEYIPSRTLARIGCQCFLFCKEDCDRNVACQVMCSYWVNTGGVMHASALAGRVLLWCPWILSGKWAGEPVSEEPFEPAAEILTNPSLVRSEEQEQMLRARSQVQLLLTDPLLPTMYGFCNALVWRGVSGDH